MKTIALFLLFAGLSSADQFYSQSDFNAAIGNRPVLSDSFADGKSNIPGVSVSTRACGAGFCGSGPGHFVPGMYVDIGDPHIVTTWTFSTPSYAFAGDWNMNPVTQGLTIIVSDSPTFNNSQTYNMPDAVVPPYQYPYRPLESFKGFWGIVSDSPFNTVRISVGDEEYPASQFYDFTNLQITQVQPAPEPESAALLLIGAGILVCSAQRKRKLVRPE